MERSLKPKGDLKPELFILGSLVAGKDFDPDLGALSCDLQFIVSPDWETLTDSGVIQTQMSEPDDSSGNRVWSHLFELFYAPKSLEGWPVGVLQVWRVLGPGKLVPLAYGKFSIPFGEGRHTVECHTWSPVGDCRAHELAYYFGSYPHLKNIKLLAQNDERWAKVNCSTSGTVVLEFTVIKRNFGN